MLGIPELAAECVIYVRQWLRIALTHPSFHPTGRDRRDSALIEPLRLLRRAGRTAIEANARSWFLKELPELSGDELEKDVQRLVRAAHAIIADELRLEDKAFLPGRGVLRPETGDTRDRALKYVTLQLTGMMSVLGLQRPLKAILESAINAAGREIYPDPAYGGLGPGRLLGSIERPQFSRRVIDAADNVAREFGLPFGNTAFRKSLMRETWHSDGDNLIALGLCVAQDLAVRTIVRSILVKPGAVHAGPVLHKHADTDILVPAFDMLSLGDYVHLDLEGRTTEFDAGEKMKAVQAVLAAAYISYKCDGLVLARHLPDGIQRSLNALGQVVGSMVSAEQGAAPPGRSSALTAAARVKLPNVRQAKRNARTGKATDNKADENYAGGLVLTRSPGERIYLGDDVVIQVTQVLGNKVMIRIKAPPALRIEREELRDQNRRDRH
jgi:carbon storage regulator CsrA